MKSFPFLRPLPMSFASSLLPHMPERLSTRSAESSSFAHRHELFSLSLLIRQTITAITVTCKHITRTPCPPEKGKERKEERASYARHTYHRTSCTWTPDVARELSQRVRMNRRLRVKRASLARRTPATDDELSSPSPAIFSPSLSLSFLPLFLVSDACPPSPSPSPAAPSLLSPAAREPRAQAGVRSEIPAAFAILSAQQRECKIRSFLFHLISAGCVKERACVRDE